MINGKKILGLIPARAGSKGIKRKNLIDVNGLPLIAYTIMEAKKSLYLDDVIVTTDSGEIAEAARGYGAEIPFLRPAELASDTAATLDVVIHAIRFLKEKGRTYDILVLLQPTSPLRTVCDIDQALSLFEEKNEQGLVSISEALDSPLLMRRIKDNGQMVRLLDQSSSIRRQDMNKTYRVNGSIYINLISEIKEMLSFNDNPVGFIMEKSHSVDVDDYSDLVIVQYYLEKRSNNSDDMVFERKKICQ